MMFSCQESGCEEKFDQREELIVHNSYHEYHQKIKDQGKKELEILETRLNMPIKCPLQDRLEGCYYFPQLPSRLICEWSSCRKEFFSAEQFYEHVSHHAHRTIDRCYWQQCNKELKNVTLTLLRDHLRVHTLQKLYACPYCGNFFSTKIKFDDHFLRHMELPEFLRDCHLQPTSVQHHTDDTYEYDIEVYEVNGGEVKVFRCSCENCDKAYLTSSLLREHIQVHSIKYRCDQCPFIAKSASRLESHKLYRHQTERNFECTICLKTFKQRGDLRAHVRRHQIVEPYRCDKCDFETLNEEGLNKHMKLHSDNNDYRCHICQRAFSRGNNLSRHLKDLHKLEPPNGLCRFRYKLNELGIYYVLDTGENESTTTTRTLSDTNNSIQRITANNTSDTNITQLTD